MRPWNKYNMGILNREPQQCWERQTDFFICLPYPCRLALFSPRSFLFLTPLSRRWHPPAVLKDYALHVARQHHTNLFLLHKQYSGILPLSLKHNRYCCWVTPCFVKDAEGLFINSLSLYLQRNINLIPPHICAVTKGAWFYRWVPQTVIDGSEQYSTSLRLSGVSPRLRTEAEDETIHFVAAESSPPPFSLPCPPPAVPYHPLASPTSTN